MTMPTTTAVPQLDAVPGNLKGTLAGSAATLVVGALTQGGEFTTAAMMAATAMGMPVMAPTIALALGLLTTAVVAGGVNYAVTHFSGLKAINTIFQAIPTLQAVYPVKADNSTMRG